jgi:sugar phosphate permease
MTFKQKASLPQTSSNHLLPWKIWACGSFFYFFQFILRISPSIITEDLMRHFNVQSYALGILSAFFYNAYALMQVPIGMIVDRFGPRKILAFSCLTTVIGTLIFSMAKSLAIASFGRLLIGAGSACALLGSIKLIILWFPPQRVGRLIGLTIFLGTLGASIGGAPLAFLVEKTNWQISFILLAFLGLCLTITIWLVVKDKNPQDNPWNRSLSPENEGASLLEGLLIIIRMPQIWIIAIYSALMYVPIAAFADLWGVPFIREIYALDRTVAASVISMIFVGAAVGSPISTFLSDHYKTRLWPMIISAFGSLLVYATIIYVPGIPLSSMYILLFLAGLFYSGKILSFASICDIVPHSVSGVAIGFANMTVMLSGVICLPLIGGLLDQFWQGKITNGLPDYTSGEWRFALIPIPISVLAALLLLKFIPETFPEQLKGPLNSDLQK